MRNNLTRRSFLGLGGAVAAGLALAGCEGGRSDGRTEVEVISYKREAVGIFDALTADFNSQSSDVYLNFSSPNDAVTIMKTRFVRENYPDVIAIGGDATYADFVDSEILADVTDYPGMDKVQDAYKDIMRSVTYVPQDGIYGVPYIANAAGILYNKDMFAEKGWEIPTTWDEFVDLCEQIKSEGEVLPLYVGFLDTWTILSPWNAMLVQLVPEDHIRQVNSGQAKFADFYREPAEKLLKLLDYAESGPFAYSYEDACTAFGKGQSAMFPCGSFAVPQILGSNPDLNVGLFPFPAGDDPDNRIVVSGVDLSFDMCAASPNRDQVYQVMDYLLEPENLQTYCDDQKAIPCTTDDIALDPLFDDIQEQLDAGQVLDYPDHSYPSGMGCDGRLQAFLMPEHRDVDRFLSEWDELWQRYNKTVIEKVQAYQSEQG